MKLFARLSIFLGIGSLLMSCQIAPLLPSTGDGGNERIRAATAFITVDKTQFYKNGEPYYFVGANFWYGASLGVAATDQARLVETLTKLKAHGITNLRVLAIPEPKGLAPVTWTATDESLGREYQQSRRELLEGLDFLLDELGKRDMHAVLHINNRWQRSGQLLQNRVETDELGFAVLNRPEQSQDWYRRVIAEVVTRTNGVNGVKYSEDPVIMAWQLADGPRLQGDAQYYGDRESWVIETADFIKSLDENHLVSTGSAGAMDTAQDIQQYADVHAHPSVDYLTFHLWPKTWGWFDAEAPDDTYSFALAQAKAYSLQHLQVANTLKKPIVLESFGLPRDSGDGSPGSTTSYRDRFFSEILQFIGQQALLGTPIAGSNFWSWEGSPQTQSPDAGANAVFDTDRSTLLTLQRHAQALEQL